MAVDVSNQAYQAIYQLVQKIVGDRAEAASYAEDPYGYVAAEGIEYDPAAGTELGSVVQQAVQDSSAPAHVQQTIQQGYAGGGYGGGGGGPAYPPPPAAPAAGQPPADYLVQHVNYVTHATYEGDDYINQQLANVEHYDYSTNIDASVDNSVDNSVSLDGAYVQGDVTVDQDNVTGDLNTVGNDFSVDTDVKTEVNTEVDIDADGGSSVAYGDGSYSSGSQYVDADNSNVQTGDGYANQNLDQTNDVDTFAVNSQVNTETAIGDDIDQDAANLAVGAGEQPYQEDPYHEEQYEEPPAVL